jgi:hypothetical protein
VYSKASADPLLAARPAENSYKMSFHEGLHKFDRKMQREAFEWMDKWLKG